MSIRTLKGKIARRVKMILSCEDPPVISGPGIWHIGACECCGNETQVAAWREKGGGYIDLCQLCQD